MIDRVSCATQWALDNLGFGRRCLVVAAEDSDERVRFVLGRYLSSSQAGGGVGAFYVESVVGPKDPDEPDKQKLPAWFLQALTVALKGDYISIVTLMWWAGEGLLEVLPADSGHGVNAPWN